MTGPNRWRTHVRDAGAGQLKSLGFLRDARAMVTIRLATPIPSPDAKERTGRSIMQSGYPGMAAAPSEP